LNLLDKRLRALGPEQLAGLRRGIEKESLRVRRDGRLAMTPHPVGLGSPLTHPHVTTDFSESQLELITGVHSRADACLEELAQIHRLVYGQLGDELLWCGSMPCVLPPDDLIPIAQFGTSNLGRARTVYRQGLANRYGPRMQTISGIHYNFSLPEAGWSALQWEPNDGYLALIRNFRRHSWLLLYLFGASPAVCASFVEGRDHRLQPLGDGTLHGPHATSLRMGPFGYQSDAQAALAVSYNDLEQYAASLETALTTPYPEYEAIGVRDGDDYRQLSPTLLQIENEFYGTVRPKRRISRGERPLHALRERGIEYVEVRLIDLDPFSPIGIEIEALRLLDVFLLHCLLSDSPPDTPREGIEIASNQHRVSERGRQAGLSLDREGRSVGMAVWGREILDDCRPIASLLDVHVGAGHGDALSAAIAALDGPELLPSARMLDAMVSAHGGSYARFIQRESLRHANTLRGIEVPAEVRREFARTAQSSLDEQRALEAGETLSFETYRQTYLSPLRLKPRPGDGIS
jgi:glutamate--cysteine ligase